MKSKAVKRYLREVGGLLFCSRESRAELLRGISDELEALPEEKSDSFEKLKTYYGKPEDTASALQEAVPPAERASAIKRKKRTTIAISAFVAVFVVMLLILIYFLLDNMTSIFVTYPPNTTGPNSLPPSFHRQ